MERASCRVRLRNCITWLDLDEEAKGVFVGVLHPGGHGGHLPPHEITDGVDYALLGLSERVRALIGLKTLEYRL